MNYNIRVRALSGEILAELTCEGTARVQELVKQVRQAHAKTDVVAKAQLKLVLDGNVLEGDVAIGNLELQASPEWVDLQLVTAIRRIEPCIGSSGKAYDKMFKFLVVGQHGVGKSSLLLRFVDGTWREHIISCIGVDFMIKGLLIDDAVRVKLQLWDSPCGKERFRSMTASWYRGANAVLVVFDLANRESFEAVTPYLGEVRRHAPEDVHIALVGNKSDLEAKHEVSDEEAKTLAEREHIQYFPVSAKDDVDVEKPFHALMLDLLEPESSSAEANSEPSNAPPHHEHCTIA